jgi:hypothetical protein
LSSYRIYLSGVAAPIVVESDKKLSFDGALLEWAHFGNVSIRIAAVAAVEKLSDTSPPAVAPIMSEGDRMPDFSHP